MQNLVPIAMMGQFAGKTSRIWSLGTSSSELKTVLIASRNGRSDVHNNKTSHCCEAFFVYGASGDHRAQAGVRGKPGVSR